MEHSSLTTIFSLRMASYVAVNMIFDIKERNNELYMYCIKCKTED